jgi:hypothetical protein
MTPAPVKVQIVEASVPSVPSWLGEVAIVAHVFTQFELIRAIQERVRFARARFGTYDVIDFAVVLLGYAVSGERTLEDFYERLLPFDKVFMALFGRENLPSHSALSRFLAALNEPVVEVLRTLFQEDLLARRPSGRAPGGIWDRQGKCWLVIDVDATRQAARQRALPHTEELPPPHRRMDLVCAPGYLGRKRGEVARTRTTVLQAHTNEWLGTFGGAGNGDYRGELLRAIQVIICYEKSLSLPLSQVLVRLDGLYGDAAPLIDILTSGLGVIVRGKDYALLNLPVVQARLALPPDQLITHPESGTRRALFDFLDVPLTPAGPCVRMIVATHPATSIPAPIGVTGNGLVSEIFFTTVPPKAFTAADVLHLYLHRGSFETVLWQEDQEQDFDRWVSHTPCGQEFWQILSQWIWNIRLELGQHLSPTPMRLTEFAPACVIESTPTLVAAPGLASDQSASREGQAQAVGSGLYGPPQFAGPSHTGGFAGSAFALQPDGTLRCPADHPLYPQERRLEGNGSLRLVYAARIGHCRSCPLREQCQGHGSRTAKPRRVSAVFQPLSSSSAGPHESLPPSIELLSQPDEPTPPSVEPSSLPDEPAPASQVVELAPVQAPDQSASREGQAQAAEFALYGPPQFAGPLHNGKFAGSAFALQPDGTLRCPADHPLYPQERRLEGNGSLRLLYVARIGHCRSCPLREQCQGHGSRTVKPRRVSAVFPPLSSRPAGPHESLPPSVEPPSLLPNEPAPLSTEPPSLPDESVSASIEPSSWPDEPLSTSVEPPSLLPNEPAPFSTEEPPSLSDKLLPPSTEEPLSLPDESVSASIEPASVSADLVHPSIEPPSSPTARPVLWEDWPARSVRRKWMNLLRTETVLLSMGPTHTEKITDGTEQSVLTRAQRAHWRLSWSQRLARNARGATAPPLEITLHGLPASFASAFALNLAAAA